MLPIGLSAAVCSPADATVNGDIVAQHQMDTFSRSSQHFAAYKCQSFSRLMIWLWFRAFRRSRLYAILIKKMFVQVQWLHATKERKIGCHPEALYHACTNGHAEVAEWLYGNCASCQWWTEMQPGTPLLTFLGKWSGSYFHGNWLATHPPPAPIKLGWRCWNGFWRSTNWQMLCTIFLPMLWLQEMRTALTFWCHSLNNFIKQPGSLKDGCHL